MKLHYWCGFMYAVSCTVDHRLVEWLMTDEQEIVGRNRPRHHRVTYGVCLQSSRVGTAGVAIIQLRIFFSPNVQTSSGPTVHTEVLYWS